MPSAYQVVPFGNPGIYRLCAAPRSLSQLTTSFFASQTLGIHHTPLFALKKFIVSWTHTISKVQTRPLVINIAINNFFSLLTLITTYFPNMSKNYKSRAPALKGGERFKRRCTGFEP